MSFKEVLCLENILENLGYPSIFLDQFRIEPRFDMMSDMLTWLVSKIDSGFQIKKNIETAKDREIFFKGVLGHMYLKVPALATVNAKKLYTSNLGCLRELLKIAKYVYKCLNVNEPLKLQGAAFIKTDVNKVRSQCNELTSSAAQLYAQLSKDSELEKIRNTVLLESIDLSKMSAHIVDETLKLKALNTKIKEELDSFLQESRNIKVKLSNKTSELERREERLSSLQKIRPTYMDEYEKLSEELQVLYSDYVTKTKNIGWLEMKYNQHVIQVDDDDSTINSNKNSEINDLLIENFKSDADDDDMQLFMSNDAAIKEEDEQSLF
eukprot:NODE_3_length_56144_cov_0.348184.p11 type:complete len:323 gc:universal NODE_3_length_56144_cov_0.348184:44496-45464(+)